MEGDTDIDASKTPKPDRFVGIISFFSAVLLYALQANGVEMNWQVSLVAYVVVIGGCIWSCMMHAIPHLGQIGRYIAAFIIFIAGSSLAFLGVHKQYRREHPLIQLVSGQDVPVQSDVNGLKNEAFPIRENVASQPTCIDEVQRPYKCISDKKLATLMNDESSKVEAKTAASIASRNKIQIDLAGKTSEKYEAYTEEVRSFSADMNSCCSVQLADLREEAMSRLGNSVNTSQEQMAWLYARPSFKGLFSAEDINKYFLYLRAMADALTNKDKRQLPFSSVKDDSTPCDGSLEMDKNTANQNGQDGIAIRGAPCHAHVRITNSVTNGNMGTGLLVDEHGGINFGVREMQEAPKTPKPTRPPQ